MLLAACQPTTEPTDVLPTLAVLSKATDDASATPVATETIEVTTEITAEVTVEASATNAAVPFPTEIDTQTPTATRTLRPVTATNTVEPTQAAIGTATQAVLEAPRYATFTAAPAGTLVAASNLQQVADVLITEQQFQEEVDLKLLTTPSIERAIVNFTAGAIVVQMTADGVTGTVTIPVTLVNNLASITISSITSDQPTTPQDYIDVATGDLFVTMVNTLDQIVKQRIGAEQKLKSIAVTDSAIEVTLLVP